MDQNACMHFNRNNKYKESLMAKFLLKYINTVFQLTISRGNNVLIWKVKIVPNIFGIIEKQHFLTYILTSHYDYMNAFPQQIIKRKNKKEKIKL